jgi:hypothetical protein
VPHLATCIFLICYYEPELGAEIDPGMSLTPLPIGQGSNPQPFDCVPSALPLDHSFRLINFRYIIKAAFLYNIFFEAFVYTKFGFGIFWKNNFSAKVLTAVVNFTNVSRAFSMNRYYFDGRGKSVRPRLTAAMSEAVNYEMGLVSSSADLFQQQQQVGVVLIITTTVTMTSTICYLTFLRGKS